MSMKTLKESARIYANECLEDIETRIIKNIKDTMSNNDPGSADVCMVEMDEAINKLHHQISKLCTIRQIENGM